MFYVYIFTYTLSAPGKNIYQWRERKTDRDRETEMGVTFVKIKQWPLMPSLLTLFSFSFLIICYHLEIFKQILRNHALDSGAEYLLWEGIVRNWVFQNCSSKVIWKFYFKTFPYRSLIFKNFKAYVTCEDCWATGSSWTGPPVTPEKCTRVISILLDSFICAFYWTAEIWNIYFRAPLLRLKTCRSWNAILLASYEINFHYSIICCPWFVPIILIQKFWNALYIYIYIYIYICVCVCVCVCVCKTTERQIHVHAWENIFIIIVKVNQRLSTI